MMFVWLGIKGVGGWGSCVGQNLTPFFFFFNKPGASHYRNSIYASLEMVDLKLLQQDYT